MLISKERLREFEVVWKESDKVIFGELCFCICTPQSKAINCDKAIRSLIEKKILFNGSIAQIRKGLKAVRFPNNKARYIFEARKQFSKKGRLCVKDSIKVAEIIKTRQWFAKNVRGIGFKEASHFLRNIGLGKDLAILDVHILKNMVKFGIIAERPKVLSKKKYLILEQELREFANQIKIPMSELDLLFWSSGIC